MSFLPGPHSDRVCYVFHCYPTRSFNFDFDVCDSEECGSSFELSCKLKMGCGHWCSGIHNGLIGFLVNKCQELHSSGVGEWFCLFGVFSHFNLHK